MTIPSPGAPVFATVPTAWPPTLSLEDQAKLRRFGVGPHASVPYACVHHAFEHWATTRPDLVAAEHEGRTITYGDLNKQANRLALRLRECGVRPGDHVGLFLRRSIPMLVGILGILKTGAAYVPQDAGIAPEAGLKHIIRVAGTKVVLTTAAFAAHLPIPDGHTLLSIDRIMSEPISEAQSAFTLGVPLGRHDGCYVLFTSGTTGKPNGVKVTHGNVANILLTTPGDLGMKPGDKVGQILNIAFDMAAWEILGALTHGSTLLLRGADIARTVARSDVVIATPTVLSQVNAHECHKVRTVAVAGEPCPRALADRWAAFSEFYNCCGPTETTIVNTMHLHTPDTELLTIGAPTPNNTVYVLDESGSPCDVGEVGEMWAGGDCVSAGYLENPDLNAERYVPDPFLGGGRLMFRTRDLGRWTPDGRLEHLGRTDDQVKIRGFRVELDAVSAVLEAMPACDRAATLKVGGHLVSFVSPASIDPDCAIGAVAASLPYYAVPSLVITLPELPVTDRGKIDKSVLRDLMAHSEAAV
ncbi:amino acid adenylation domain-containing protein [Amycolatopsis japonica]